MKVRLLTSRAGVNWFEDEGDVVEMSNSEALTMIRAGQAEAVTDEPAEDSSNFKRQRKGR